METNKEVYSPSTAVMNYSSRVTTTSTVKCTICRQNKCRCYIMLSLYFAAYSSFITSTDLKALASIYRRENKKPDLTPMFQYNGYNDSEYKAKDDTSPYGPIERPAKYNQIVAQNRKHRIPKEMF